MRFRGGGWWGFLGAWLLLGSVLGGTPLPEVRVTSDDTVITRSCRIVIPAGTRIPDLNTNGVLQIAADHVTIDFAPGTVLQGAPDQAPGDALRGIGIRIDGHRGVTVRGARVRGFFNGLVATAARAPGRCVVIVTHDPRTYAYADRLTEMEDGRVAAVHHGDALKSFIQSHH